MTTDKTTDFGDVLEQMIKCKKIQAIEQREQAKKDDEAFRQIRLEAMRPLLTVLTQVKAKYPKASIWHLDCTLNRSPMFYLTNDLTIEVVWNPETSKFWLLEGYPRTSATTNLIQSSNAEDLIPVLLDKLTQCKSV